MPRLDPSAPDVDWSVEGVDAATAGQVLRAAGDNGVATDAAAALEADGEFVALWLKLCALWLWCFGE